ncbi:glycoside hydrolase family 104 protein [Burkholderia sp. BCC1988]|uniref:glycoside hydrolase family 24 protein n=1 Tax=Burkholderia sp. BCC1988 TaxID=2817443 RepID=UPI002AB165EC|nr:glycoside hydrolase family 104 protein [Burkholderia sp. BCC1988]
MSAAPLLILAAGALMLMNASAAEQDAASFTPGDVFGGITGDYLDMTTSATGINGGNRQAFLDMTARSELGAALIAETDNGYNVLVGATAANPLTFSDYSTHPRILNRALDSTAAGRYQINWPTFQTLARQTGVSDFSPDTQDMFALTLAANKGALADIDAGNIEAAIARCAPVWASFAGAGYGQHENTLASLVGWFQAAGGTVA